MIGPYAHKQFLKPLNPITAKKTYIRIHLGLTSAALTKRLDSIMQFQSSSLAPLRAGSLSLGPSMSRKTAPLVLLKNRTEFFNKTSSTLCR